MSNNTNPRCCLNMSITSSETMATTTTITTSDPPTSTSSSRNFDWSNNYAALDPILNSYIRFWFGRSPNERKLRGGGSTTSRSSSKNGETPLMEAIRNGDESSVFMILLYDRHVNYYCSTSSSSGGGGGVTLLSLKNSTKQRRQQQGEAKASGSHSDNNDIVNMKDKYGNTALHYAVDNALVENINLVRLLLEQGNADVTCINRNGEPALFYPACYGHLNVLRLMLDHDSSSKMLQYQNENENEQQQPTEAVDLAAAAVRLSEKGDTALHVAAAHGRYDSIRVLLSHSSSSSSSSSPVQAAAVTQEKDGRDGNDATHVHLRRSPSSSSPSSRTNTFLVNIGNDLEETPLHKAAKGGHYKAVQELLLFGSNVNCRTKKGLTPLHCACGNRTVDDDNNSNPSSSLSPISQSISLREVVSTLLQHGGADIHAVDRGGRTPLHYAAKRGKEDLVRLLINKGADIHLQDNYGYTPLRLASPRRNKNSNVIRLLSSLGAT